MNSSSTIPNETKTAFKNQTVIDYYSAPISQYVDLKEHKLILQDISEEEKDTIAALIACAILFGDITAASYFRTKLEKGDHAEKFKEIILAKIKELKNHDHVKRLIDKCVASDSQKNVYNLFCRYGIRFECRQGVSPTSHSVDKAKTLEMFGLKPDEDKYDTQQPLAPVNTILTLLKRELAYLTIPNGGLIDNYISALKKHQADESISKLLKLFSEGNYLEFHALLQTMLNCEKKPPSFKEIIFYNNAESFEAAMAELKFNSNIPECENLLYLAIENGKTHAVEYFIKQGMKFEIDKELLFALVSSKYNSMVNLYLKSKSHKSDYQKILKHVFEIALWHGNLELIKMFADEQLISSDEIVAAIFNRSLYQEWESVNYLTYRFIEKIIDKGEKFSPILTELIRDSYTKERIVSLLTLLNHLRKDKKIDILELCGDMAIVNALESSIPNNDNKEDILAKIELLSFFLKENKEVTKRLLQTRTQFGGCLLASLVKANVEIINFLSELHKSHNVPLPNNLLSEAFQLKASDNVIHSLLLDKELNLELKTPNFALLCSVEYESLGNRSRFQASQMKKEIIQELYARGADPFCPFPTSEISPEIKLAPKSVMDHFEQDHKNFDAIRCMIPLYQFYFDKISDILRDFVQPNVLNHLVMSYANNTPYFASIGHTAFFACKEARKTAMQNHVSTSKVADQKSDATDQKDDNTKKTVNKV